MTPKPRKDDAMFSYNDFFNCTIDGQPMSGEMPRIFGDFNVAWPPNWTPEMAENYRREHGILAPQAAENETEAIVVHPPPPPSPALIAIGLGLIIVALLCGWLSYTRGIP